MVNERETMVNENGIQQCMLNAIFIDHVAANTINDLIINCGMQLYASDKKNVVFFK